MKTIFSLIILFAVFSACNQNTDSDQLPGSIVNNPASMGKEPEGNIQLSVLIQLSLILEKLLKAMWLLIHSFLKIRARQIWLLLMCALHVDALLHPGLKK